eukprot:10712827-Heterocapsa_arctica.AAC.1
MDPTIKWEQDYVDFMGWDTARECVPAPPEVRWEHTAPRHYRRILGTEIPIYDTEVAIPDTEAGSSTDTRSTAWS